MEDECIPCPDNPWLIPLMIVLALIFGMIAYRKLKKMRLNFMIISMLFDHMQILSLLAGAKISWPWQIKILLKFFVFFTFDIDVAGPECLARSFLTFERKWYLKVTMPFLAVLFILFNTALQTIQEWCVGKINGRLHA